MIIKLPERLDATEVRVQLRGMICWKNMRINQLRDNDNGDAVTAQQIINQEVSDISLLELIYQGTGDQI